MPSLIATVMLQEVTNEEIYNELDLAMADEGGYPYITDTDDKIFALLPDQYEFEVDASANEVLNAIKLICSTIEKKHNLPKTPILVYEVTDMKYTNLQELSDENFQTLN